MSRPRAASSRLAPAAVVFAALGDETRLRLVTLLCTAGPQHIARLSESVPVTRQAVTKHLRTLSDAGLVRARRHGRRRPRTWELDPRGFDEARRYLDGVSRLWDDTLERLRAFVEE